MISELHRSPTLWVGSYNSILVQVWLREGTLEGLDLVERLQDKLLERHRQGVSSLTILRNVRITKAPVDGLRERAQELQKKYAPHTIGSAQVIEMSGLAGTMARAFVTGLSLVTRTEAPTKVFESVSPATDWLAGLPRQYPELRDKGITLAKAIDDLKLA